MGYTLHISGSSPVQNPLGWWISDPVQSKSAWTGLDYESSGLIQSIPYSEPSATRCCPYKGHAPESSYESESRAGWLHGTLSFHVVAQFLFMERISESFTCRKASARFVPITDFISAPVVAPRPQAIPQSGRGNMTRRETPINMNVARFAVTGGSQADVCANTRQHNDTNT